MTEKRERSRGEKQGVPPGWYPRSDRYPTACNRQRTPGESTDQYDGDRYEGADQEQEE